MGKIETCPSCGYKLVKHRTAGRGRFKAYPNLKVCENCWTKYAKVDGKRVRISKTGGIMK